MSALGIGHGAAPGGVGGAWFLAREDLGLLINLLREDGRRLIGPTIADDAVVYDEITSVAQLPAGWRTKQEPGKYRIEHRDSDRLFDYVISPTAWKRFTYPPRVPLTIGRKDGSQVTFADAEPDAPPLAFLGVRACELTALGIQDRVFLGGPYIEEDYRVRRRNAIVVAVQCTTSNSTCFCTSMSSGPEVRGGHDLALTELESGFVLEVGSEVGSRLLERLPVAAATIDQAVEAAREVAAVRASIGDPVATAGTDVLLAKADRLSQDSGERRRARAASPPGRPARGVARRPTARRVRGRAPPRRDRRSGRGAARARSAPGAAARPGGPARVRARRTGRPHGPR